LPESVDKDLRELAGDDLTGWLRKAIAEQVQREKKKELKCRQSHVNAIRDNIYLGQQQLPI